MCPFFPFHFFMSFAIQYKLTKVKWMPEMNLTGFLFISLNIKKTENKTLGNIHNLQPFKKWFNEIFLGEEKQFFAQNLWTHPTLVFFIFLCSFKNCQKYVWFNIRQAGKTIKKSPILPKVFCINLINGLNIQFDLTLGYFYSH